MQQRGRNGLWHWELQKPASQTTEPRERRVGVVFLPFYVDHLACVNMKVKYDNVIYTTV